MKSLHGTRTIEVNHFSHNDAEQADLRVIYSQIDNDRSSEDFMKMIEIYVCLFVDMRDAYGP